ncbi:hypothetical protein F5H01DRAFT_321953 [Linnemannia elongata]|nr:hypothetical protein F5H01DRAFT_321953 [Linnemannia elongata]
MYDRSGGMLGVAKYSKEYNDHKRLKSKRHLRAKVRRLRVFIRPYLLDQEKEGQELERLERDVGQMRIADEHKVYPQRLQQNIAAVAHTDFNLYLDKLKLQAATADT